MKIGRVERITKSGPCVVFNPDGAVREDDDAKQNSLDEAERLPKFPGLKGPADDLARGITNDLPYEHKALCIMCYIGLQISGCAFLASDPYLQPRFYGAMVGPPGTGKSASEKEVRHAATRAFPDIHIEFSIDSGPALVEALAEHPRTMLVCDEVADTFDKGRQTPGSHNSLFGELLRLYEGNETGRRVVKKNAEPISVTNAHFALIGGATPERFDRMWQGTGGAAGGLQSRFALSFSEQTLPAIRTPNREGVINASCDALRETFKRPRTVKLSGDAQDLIVAWSNEGDRAARPRILDMAKRFSLIVAASDDRAEVDVDTMARGLQFAEYQIAVHEKLMPADSSGWTQAFENRILAFFKRHPEASERDLRRSISPEKYPGGYGSFQQATGNLIRTQKLIKTGTNRVGNTVWKAD
jgi:hypothetical protein